MYVHTIMTGTKCDKRTRCLLWCVIHF